MKNISIHGTRGGADTRYCCASLKEKDFNPRHPWGCRLYDSCHILQVGNFNPRHPWGCRLDRPASGLGRLKISIHGTRGGADERKLTVFVILDYFNPRHPWGCRRLAVLTPTEVMKISIHGTRGGADSRIAQENGAKNWCSCVICKKILKVLLGLEGVLGFVVV